MYSQTVVSHQLSVDQLSTLLDDVLCACQHTGFSSQLRQLGSFLFVCSALTAKFVNVSLELSAYQTHYIYIYIYICFIYMFYINMLIVLFYLFIYVYIYKTR